MIVVEDLRKLRAERPILDGVSLGVRRGEVLALIGASGAGKSTLLRCMGGLEPFDGGSLHVGDVAVPPAGRDHHRACARIRGRVGFVFQQYHLFPHRTALGNVAEGPIVVRGMAPREASLRARELLEQVGLGHRQDAYPHELSGGEQQRVAIARALAMDPEVLLLDEPTAALDPQRTVAIAELLVGLSRRGLTMVIATHELSFARRVATRLLVLGEGRVVEQGPPEEVLGRPCHEQTRALLGQALAP